MKTTQRTFLDYLGAPHTHFIIPVYQRVYTWSDKQCATLWRDCAHAGETQSEHFIGTVLFQRRFGGGNLIVRVVGIAHGKTFRPASSNS